MTPAWWVPIVVAAIAAFGGWMTAIISKERAAKSGPIDDMEKVTNTARSIADDLRKDLKDAKVEIAAADAKIERLSEDFAEREAVYKQEIAKLRERVTLLEKGYRDLGGDLSALNGK